MSQVSRLCLNKAQVCYPATVWGPCSSDGYPRYPTFEGVLPSMSTLPSDHRLAGIWPSTLGLLRSGSVIHRTAKAYLMLKLGRANGSFSQTCTCKIFWALFCISGGWDELYPELQVPRTVIEFARVLLDIIRISNCCWIKFQAMC